MAVEVREACNDLYKGIEDLCLGESLVVLATTVKPLLQGASLGVFLHDIEPTVTCKSTDEANDVWVAIEHHQYLDLAQHLGRARRLG